MLRSVKETFGYRIQATDGELGKLRDLLFDEVSWTVRYFSLDTGGWLLGREVLIAPQALQQLDWETRTLSVKLTSEQVKRSPEASSDRPVSRQHEEALARYYGWAPYWVPTPLGPPSFAVANPSTPAPEPTGDPHLRSVREVIGYSISATDDRLGELHDFVADTDRWAIRYVIADTRKWLPGKKVLLSPEWVTRIDWSQRTFEVDLTAEQVRGSPEFEPSAPINREVEQRLYDYYGRPVRQT